MDCFFRANKLNNVILSGVFVAFSVASVIPPSIYGQTNHIELNDITFGVKIHRLIDKAWKYYNKLDSENLLDIVLDIKTEIESYTGVKIDLDKQIDQIESEFKKRLGKVPKKEFKQFRSMVKKKSKKHHDRSVCVAYYLNDGLNMSFEDYESLYLTDIAKSHEKEQKEQEELPLKFVVAVTLILGGGFVMLASSVCPLCAYAGETMMGTGFAMLLDQGLDIYQKEY